MQLSRSHSSLRSYKVSKVIITLKLITNLKNPLNGDTYQTRRFCHSYNEDPQEQKLTIGYCTFVTHSYLIRVPAAQQIEVIFSLAYCCNFTRVRRKNCPTINASLLCFDNTVQNGCFVWRRIENPVLTGFAHWIILIQLFFFWLSRRLWHHFTIHVIPYKTNNEGRW